MDQENVVYPLNGVFFSSKKESKAVTRYNLEEL